MAVIITSAYFKIFFLFLLFLVCIPVHKAQINQPQYYGQIPTNRSTSNNSAAFRQEIARFDITVVRPCQNSLPISQVPRVQGGDVIKVKILNEVVGGIKPDQSLYNWNFLVAFVNPNMIQ